MLQDIVTIARYDIATTFRGKKGLALAGLFFSLAAIPAALRLFGAHSGSALDLQRAQTAALVRMYDSEIARSLLDCPAPLITAAIATFFFQPLLTFMTGADRLAAEIDAGTVRFWASRAPRGVIVLGRTLGLWAVVALLTAGALLVVTVVAVVDAPAEWSGTLAWAGRIIAVSAALALVYAAACNFLNVLLGRRQFIVASGLALLFLLRMGRMLLHHRGMSDLESLLPGTLDRLFFTPGAGAKAVALAVVTGWTALFATVATAIFSRRTI
jgi:ABC-type transport system involved in multi-copper enzyme maturation permease subunit